MYFNPIIMKNLLVVVYNDRYGDGTYTSVEGITDNFPKWLREHNEQRTNDGNEPEAYEEFSTFQYIPQIFNTQ